MPHSLHISANAAKALGAVAVAACLGTACKETKVYNWDDYRSPVELYTDADTLIYGFCGAGSAMNTLQIITSNDDTLTLDVERARRQGNILGNYNVGDEMAVAVNADTTVANLVINKSALLGDWVMPNPLDGSSETGISIKEGGEAESIEVDDVNYRSWRLYNGKLRVVEVHDDGTGIEETAEYTILCLMPDSLALREDNVEIDPNMKEKESILEYKRLKLKPEADLGIHLDDSDIDLDFMF